MLIVHTESLLTIANVYQAPIVCQALDALNLFFFSFFVFLEPYPRHGEVPWLGVESEL